MRIHNFFAAAILSLVTPVSSIFADEAQLSYHHELIGAPMENSTFFAPPYAGAKGSLIFSLSELGVLGAVNPKDGVLVWRQQLLHNRTEATEVDKILREGSNQGLLYAAVGSELSAWDSSEGKVAWKKSFTQGETIKDIRVLPGQETDELLVLLEGDNATARILKLDTNSGSPKWTYEDTTGDSPYGLATSVSGLYYVSLSKALLKGYRIKVTTIDDKTGTTKDSVNLSSENDVRTVEDILFLGMPSAPFIAWSDPGRSNIYINVLGSKTVATSGIKSKTSPVTNIKIHAPNQANAKPHLLAHLQSSTDHWAEVFHINAKSKQAVKEFELDKLDGSGAYSVSTVGTEVYFARITPFETSIVLSTSEKYLGRWIMPSQLGIPGLQDDERLSICHASSEVVVRTDGSHALRTSAFMSTGDWIQVRNDAVDWVRHESLSEAVQANFGYISKGADSAAEEIWAEEDLDILSAFTHRIQRHLKLLRSLPDLIQVLPDLVSSWFQSFVAPGLHDLRKDVSFGFDKLIIVLTKNDRLVALETHNQGRVIWNRKSTCKGSLFERVICAQVSVDAFGNSVRSSPLNIWIERDEPLRGRGASSSQPRETSYTHDSNGVRGFQRAADSTAKVQDIWHFSPLPGQQIVSVVSRLYGESVASIGKALADRSVLYKYLDPNLILVTALDAEAQRASFYLLDAVSGTEITAFHHSSVDTSRPVNSLLSENWLTYSFTSVPSDETSAAGSQLVVAELYESSIPNDRGPLGSSANFSNIEAATSMVPTLPYIVSQAYVVPEEITSMAVTQTTQGITSRHLLVTLGSHGVVSIPRQVLDPRRTLGKPPPQAQAMEEGLTQYAPVIDFIPQWYLSHVRNAAVDNVIARPSDMESTSLVFAWGLDVFGGRVAPSFTFDILGANFNKIQLVLTVIGLFIGTIAVAPIVGRKGVNGLWQSPT